MPKLSCLCSYCIQDDSYKEEDCQHGVYIWGYMLLITFPLLLSHQGIILICSNQMNRKIMIFWNFISGQQKRRVKNSSSQKVGETDLRTLPGRNLWVTCSSSPLYHLGLWATRPGSSPSSDLCSCHSSAGGSHSTLFVQICFPQHPCTWSSWPPLFTTPAPHHP